MSHTPSTDTRARGKPQLALDPSARADAALGAVLQALLATIRANEAGTREARDPEYLHDFRVAVRRTRAALGQMKGVFPGAETRHFRTEFAWLGQASGETRDLDVHLLHFDDLQASLPAPLRPPLEPLREILQTRQRQAHRALVALLDGARYRQLLDHWAAFLAALPTPDPHPRNAARPILVVAHERTWRAYRRVVKEGRALGPDAPDEDFHELRKSCKKLRYLLEFFQSLFPGEIKHLIKHLKDLQENLGAHQDQVVQTAFLGELADQWQTGGGAADTLGAIDALVTDLIRQQQASRAAFAARFETFIDAGKQVDFRALCRSTPIHHRP